MLFWNGFTGPDGRTMLALVRRFNEENPDVQVTMQRMAWATYYNKLFVGLGGRAPEISVLQSDAFARFRGPMKEVGLRCSSELLRRCIV
jgi:multiple sugar transport system substrate-binding protein